VNAHASNRNNPAHAMMGQMLAAVLLRIFATALFLRVLAAREMGLLTPLYSTCCRQFAVSCILEMVLEFLLVRLRE